jgi:hypothetical protein
VASAGGASALARIVTGARHRWRRLAGAPTRFIEERIRLPELRERVEHVVGPERVDCGPDEVLAICVVRNGAAHVPSFVEHHLALGVRHIVLLDTGSTDETIALASAHDAVTVLRTACPYARYENPMKRYLARRFSTGRWNLCVDIDERFDYPFSESLPLRELLAYLNRERHGALVAQMLDLFPAGSLAELAAMDQGDFLRTHIHYDLSDIRRSTYLYGTPSNEAIAMHWGGIRRTLFGTENGLTKAALVRVDPGVELFTDWHHVEHARLADVSGVLLHYPFAGGFAAKVDDAARTGRYGPSATREYRRYHERLREGADVTLPTPDARTWRGATTLVDEGFLEVGMPYLRWVEAHRAARVG